MRPLDGLPAAAGKPLLGLSAPTGTGKTTLARYLIGVLVERGVRVGVIKQARNDFDVDRDGKDSFRLRQAGIERLLLGSECQSALIIESRQQRAAAAEPGLEHELKPELEPELQRLLALLDLSQLDLILIEGFSGGAFPIIELSRENQPRPCRARYLHDPWVIAVATDRSDVETSLPLLDINDPWTVADFIQRYVIGAATPNEKVIP